MNCATCGHVDTAHTSVSCAGDSSARCPCGTFTVIVPACDRTNIESYQKVLDLMDDNAKLRAEVKLMEDEGHKLIDSQMQRAEAAEKALHDVELQNRAAEPVIGAARLMVKHQADRHELSSCCHDVTPTSAYLLARALKEWDETQKRVEESPKPYQRGDDVSDDAMMG